MPLGDAHLAPPEQHHTFFHAQNALSMRRRAPALYPHAPKTAGAYRDKGCALYDVTSCVRLINLYKEKPRKVYNPQR